jgi:hypothetical protein
MANSLVAGSYEKTVDRESAYERLKGRAAASPTTGGGGAATAPVGTGAGTRGGRRRRPMTAGACSAA